MHRWKMTSDGDEAPKAEQAAAEKRPAREIKPPARPRFDALKHAPRANDDPL